MASNAQIIYMEFIKAGYSPIQAAAAVGRFQAESGQRLSTTVKGDPSIPGGSQGIMQANKERLAALKEFGGDKWTDPAVQARFAIHEMGGSERTAGNMLRNAQTPLEAVDAMMAYERPHGWTMANPSAGSGYADTVANTRNLIDMDPNTMAALPSAGAGNSGNSPDTSQGGLGSLMNYYMMTSDNPTMQAMGQAQMMSAGGKQAGISSFLPMMAMQQDTSPPPQPVQMERPKQQSMSPDQFGAQFSDTPNVYYSRLRRQQGQV